MRKVALCRSNPILVNLAKWRGALLSDASFMLTMKRVNGIYTRNSC
jgi:hypothetical protein